MATLGRVCMNPNCEAEIKPPHMLCVKHWASLPPRVKAAVSERLYGWKDNGAARDFLSTWFRSEGKAIAR